jgi:hypothetical protein
MQDKAFLRSDLPDDGQITFRKSEEDRLCPALLRKIFIFRFSENHAFLAAVPFPYEGRFAIVTSVGSGMRWTRSDCKTCNADPYGKSVWSWHPWAGAKPARRFAGDGD